MNASVATATVRSNPAPAFNPLHSTGAASYERPAMPAFGVGYGRSSGYVRRPSYVREWGPARFRTR